MNSDHADETILAAPDPLGVILAMAIDPADSQVLYVAAGPAPPRFAAGPAPRPKKNWIVRFPRLRAKLAEASRFAGSCATRLGGSALTRGRKVLYVGA